MPALLLILGLFFLGAVVRRTGMLPESTPLALNLYALYVAVPALILLRVPSLSLSGAILAPALMPWVALAVSAGLVLAFARRRGLDRSTTGALLMVVPLGNTSFLGFPMVKALLGDQALPYAVIYDQLGSFVAVITYGSFVLARYGGGTRPSVVSVSKRLVVFPPFLALLLALATRGIAFPRPLVAFLEAVAVTLVPAVMIAVGLQFDLRPERGNGGPIAFGLTVKLVVAPLVVLALCRAFGLEGDAARATVLEAAMPPMVTGGALAAAAGLAPRLAASLVGLGLLLSFLTLPLWMLGVRS